MEIKTANVCSSLWFGGSADRQFLNVVAACLLRACKHVPCPIS